MGGTYVVVAAVGITLSTTETQCLN